MSSVRRRTACLAALCGWVCSQRAIRTVPLLKSHTGSPWTGPSLSLFIHTSSAVYLAPLTSMYLCLQTPPAPGLLTVKQLFGLHIKKRLLKTLLSALAWWLSWSDCHPLHKKVVGSIPGQGTDLGCGFNSQSGPMWEATNRCFSHQCLSPFLK